MEPWLEHILAVDGTRDRGQWRKKSNVIGGWGSNKFYLRVLRF